MICQYGHHDAPQGRAGQLQGDAVGQRADPVSDARAGAADSRGVPAAAVRGTARGGGLRLFDLGFNSQMTSILTAVQPEKQLLMFPPRSTACRAATVPPQRQHDQDSRGQEQQQQGLGRGGVCVAQRGAVRAGAGDGGGQVQDAAAAAGRVVRRRQHSDLRGRALFAADGRRVLFAVPR